MTKRKPRTRFERTGSYSEFCWQDGIPSVLTLIAQLTNLRERTDWNHHFARTGILVQIWALARTDLTVAAKLSPITKPPEVARILSSPEILR